MHEKKNKLSQPTTILIEISVWLSDAVYSNVNEKMRLKSLNLLKSLKKSLKHSFLMGALECIDFSDNIGHFTF